MGPLTNDNPLKLPSALTFLCFIYSIPILSHYHCDFPSSSAIFNTNQTLAFSLSLSYHLQFSFSNPICWVRVEGFAFCSISIVQSLKFSLAICCYSKVSNSIHPSNQGVISLVFAISLCHFCRFILLVLAAVLFYFSHCNLYACNQKHSAKAYHFC